MAVILVVEDDVFIRQIAEMMIQDTGHDILSASDGDEALLFLRSAQHIDALFTDIYLKNSVLGGCELAVATCTGTFDQFIHCTPRPLVGGLGIIAGQIVQCA